MSRCFFCTKHELHPDNFPRDLSTPISCTHCGNYEIIRDAKINCEKDFEFRAKGAAIAQEMKNQGKDGYTLYYNRDVNSRENADTIFVDNRPFLINYPKDYLEIIDRVLLNIGHKTSFSPLNFYEPEVHEFGLFYVNPMPSFYDNDMPSSNDYADIRLKMFKTISVLLDLEYITQDIPRSNTVVLHPISVTPKGLERIRAIRNDKSQNPVSFLAMSFAPNDVLDKYMKVVGDAAVKAGYNEPTRIDKNKYNGHIMNEMINRIKESRFLIADLTCEYEEIDPKNYYKNGVRGGVYYEAGFAEGLGIPVILTCHKNCKTKGLVHFDLDQFNMILWEERGNEICVAGREEKLDDYLKEWIIKTVGEGPKMPKI